MVENDSKPKLNFRISRDNELETKEFKKLKQYNLKKEITKYNLKIKNQKNYKENEEKSYKSKSTFNMKASKTYLIIR